MNILRTQESQANLARSPFSDAAEYELEYVGDDTLLFDSDDHETAMVKWIDSFLTNCTMLPAEYWC